MNTWSEKLAKANPNVQHITSTLVKGDFSPMEDQEDRLIALIRIMVMHALIASAAHFRVSRLGDCKNRSWRYSHRLINGRHGPQHPPKGTKQ